MTALGEVSAWLRCPVCREPLSLRGTTLHCSSAHTYDVARQGYVNLLGHGAPQNADTLPMVEARQRFLAGGHYQSITNAVAASVHGAQRVLEVGAGTGHHLAGVLEHLPHAHGLALDVSIPASRRAARAHPRIASVVADTWAGIPLADGSVDAVLCIFAPRNFAEFARVLSDDGVVVVVIPRPEHLAEMRRSHGLLDVGEKKMDRLVEAALGHLDIVSSMTISHDLELTGQQASDLVAMGPNAFHTTMSLPASRVRVSVECITMKTVAGRMTTLT